MECEAIVKADQILSKDETKFTLPMEKNIHSFTAVEDS